MATHKPRLLVTLESKLYGKVRRLASANGVPLSLAARDLIREACEDVEDLGLLRLARERLKSLAGRRPISHTAFWRKVRAA